MESDYSDYHRVLKIDNINEEYSENMLKPLYKTAGNVELIYSISGSSVIIVFDESCCMERALEITRNLWPNSITEVISDSQLRKMKGRKAVPKPTPSNEIVDRMLDDMLIDSGLLKKTLVVNPISHDSKNTCSVPDYENNDDYSIKSPDIENCGQALEFEEQQPTCSTATFVRGDPRLFYRKIGVRPIGQPYNPREPSFPPPLINEYMERFVVRRGAAFSQMDNYFEPDLAVDNNTITSEYDLRHKLNCLKTKNLRKKYFSENTVVDLHENSLYSNTFDRSISRESSPSLSFSSFSEEYEDDELTDNDIDDDRVFKKRPITSKNEGPKKKFKSSIKLDTWIYFANFPLHETEKDIFNLFKRCGFIVEIDLEPDTSSKHTLNGYVHFGSVFGVTKAIKLNNTIYKGKRIRVVSLLQ